MICAVCDEDKETEMQPSRSQLIFGGFPAQLEAVCKECDRKLAKDMGAYLRQNFPVPRKPKGTKP